MINGTTSCRKRIRMSDATDPWTCNCLQSGLGGDCDGSCQHPPPLFVACEFCQTEGRIYTQRGNHPDDVTDHGECPVCHGVCIVEVEAKPATLEDMQNV